MILPGNHRVYTETEVNIWVIILSVSKKCCQNKFVQLSDKSEISVYTIS